MLEMSDQILSLALGNQNLIKPRTTGYVTLPTELLCGPGIALICLVRMYDGIIIDYYIFLHDCISRPAFIIMTCYCYWLEWWLGSEDRSHNTNIISCCSMEVVYIIRSTNSTHNCVPSLLRWSQWPMFMYCCIVHNMALSPTRLFPSRLCYYVIFTCGTCWHTGGVVLSLGLSSTCSINEWIKIGSCFVLVLPVLDVDIF